MIIPLEHHGSHLLRQIGCHCGSTVDWIEDSTLMELILRSSNTLMVKKKFWIDETRRRNDFASLFHQ